MRCFYKKKWFFGKNGQNWHFASPDGLKRLITPKILFWWKNACPNFFSVRSEEKKCPQKILDTTHSLGCGTPLVILFGAKDQFSRHLQAKLLVLDKNVILPCSIICARSTTLNFIVGSKVWQEIPKSHLKKLSWKAKKYHLWNPSARKRIKRSIKNFVRIFSLLPTEKKIDKHLFIRTIFWKLLALI